MQLKPLIAAVALAAVSFSAAATTQALGSLSPGVSALVGDNFPTGSPFFSDFFTFTTSAGAVSGSAFSSGITDFTVILLNSSFMQVGTADTTPTSFSFSGLSAGTSYALQFVGVASTGGFYGGSVVAAVPEPETYALMLAGLGAMGFIAVRRRRG